MKVQTRIVILSFVLLLVFYAGCGSAPPVEEPLPQLIPTEKDDCQQFAPAAIDVLPLTEFITAGNSGTDSVIKVYVAILDSFGSQIKAPVNLRFELYEYVQRSAEPRGKRMTIWPDLDITDPAANNDHWQDFLRAYRFELLVGQTEQEEFILEITCLYPTGKRISSDFILRR